eukprot:CAMPEP_0171759766 /NCGR_PEP_ID=MMETSP0991-20121206/47077_1 /TAXON_ID=483369 /ORGANISM="non described non described, Strain CCMP2098" /LENGTH=805 /DNA_ID=CAMNT_0012362743 /DNA_START=61 /DNA_END=2478 /DNA_ORIENTATION=-
MSDDEEELDRAEQLMKETGFEWDAFQEDEGKLAAQSIPKLIAATLDTTFSVKDRVTMAGAFETFCSMAEMEVKLQPIKNAFGVIFPAIEQILLLPDDNDCPKDDYDDEGLQTVACKLANAASSLAGFPGSGDFGAQAWGPAVAVLSKCSKVSYKDPTPMRGDGPAVKRKDALQYLWRTAPAYQDLSSATAPQDLLSTCQLYSGEGKCLSSEAGNAMQFAAQSKGGAALLGDNCGSLFEALANGDKTVAQTLAGQASELYGKHPEVFEANVEVMLDKMDFMFSAGIFAQMSMGGSGRAFAPFVLRLIKLVEEGTIQHGMDSIVFTVLSGAAKGDPDAVYPHLERIVPLGLKTANSDMMTCQVIQNCALATHQGWFDKVLSMPLEGPGCVGPHVPTSALAGVNTCLALVGSDTAVLEPHMKTFLQFKTSHAPQVDPIVDWYEGRSLKKLDDRMEALELKVAAMNDEFAATCQNMDDVSKLMDEKIADLKDFVGEIVKKLPQPCRMVVVGGVRKTLLLHFACARTGATVTTETKDWNQWCKVGFGLLKLGKCAVEAAAGNPMAVAGGLGAIKSVYDGYKAKDDKDFNTFISQPFLTSEESDKLINQLRSGKFFEKMEYDAQLGDWVCLGSLEADEVAKRDAKKQAVSETKQNVTQQKGKNFGLGGFDKGMVGGVLAAAGDASVMSGGEGAEELEMAHDASEMASAASGVAAIATKEAAAARGGKTPATKQPLTQIKKAPASPTSPSSPKKKGGMFGSLFGSSSKKLKGGAAGVGLDAGERVLELEQRVALLEEQVQKLLQAAETVKTA